MKRRIFHWRGRGGLLTLAIGTVSGEVQEMFQKRAEVKTRLIGELSSAIRKLDFTPNGKQLAAGSADGRVVVWETAERRELRSYRHEAGVSALGIGYRGNRLAVGCEDGNVWVYDLTQR